ncbi:MAG: hypothetical protein PWR15_1567, partial [Bacteroidota bacterium]|nr:hypothetical protein [Bacteroidota bacterium]
MKYMNIPNSCFLIFMQTTNIDQSKKMHHIRKRNTEKENMKNIKV